MREPEDTFNVTRAAAAESAGGGRRRLYWCAAAVALGVGLIVGLTFGLSAARSASSGHRLRDGTVVKLEAVTYGQRHRYQPGPPWAALGTTVPVLQSLLKTPAPVEVPTQQDSLVAWVTCRGAGRNLGFLVPGSVAAVDQHGCPFPSRMIPRPLSFLPVGGGTEYVAACESPAFPKRAASFRLQVGSVGDNPDVFLEVPNPVRGAYPAWTGGSLPLTRQAGGARFTLERLATWIFEGESANSRPSSSFAGLRLTQDGKPLRDWEVVSAAVSDATGNRVETPNLVPDRSPASFTASGLCALEPAWKVAVNLQRTRSARFGPGEAWTIPDLPVPGPGRFVKIGSRATLRGISSRLVSVSGPGQTAFQDGIPVSAKPLRTAPSGAVHVRSSGKLLLARSAMPFLLLRLEGYSGDPRLRFWGTDEQGREVRFGAMQDWGTHGSYWHCLPLRVPRGARRLRLLVTADRPTGVEFLVKPPPPVRITDPVPLLARGEHRRAAAEYRKLLEVEPEDADGCNNLAWIWVTEPGLGTPAEAVRFAERAARLEPGNPNILNTLGVAYYRAGRWAEAAAALRKGIAAGEEGGTAFDWFFLAMSHHRLGQPGLARIEYQTAVRWWKKMEGQIPPDWQRELTRFRTEADRVLAGPGVGR